MQAPVEARAQNSVPARAHLSPSLLKLSPELLQVLLLPHPCEGQLQLYKEIRNWPSSRKLVLLAEVHPEVLSCASVHGSILDEALA